MTARPAGGRSNETPGAEARAAALSALLSINEKGLALDEAMRLALGGRSLETRDRALARLIVTTVLRRRGQIDWLINELRDGRGEVGPARVLETVRIGLAQLLFLGTPAYAAVSSTLALLDGPRNRKARGLVNALLRRADRTISDLKNEPALGDAAQAAQLNLPPWLMDPLSAAYGTDTTLEIARAHLAEPPLDLTMKEPGDDWADRLGAQSLPTGNLRRSTSGLITDLPGFSEGSWWVQDVAASLPARLFGSVKGRTVVDLCAAPGGKTAQLASAGANVIAVDRSKNRLTLLEENLSRLALSAQIVCSDALTWVPDQKFDAILLDAPCSATGTIRRHPDIPWTRGPADVEKLADLQGRLLRKAVDLLAPGGTLVWCTCSLLPQEGEDQIGKLLAETNTLERVPVGAEEIGGLSQAITPHGDVRTLPSFWPDLGGMDGFHITRLKFVA